MTSSARPRVVAVVTTTLLVAVAGAGVGLATGHVVTASVDLRVPRQLFHRSVGPLLIDGRMLPAVWPGAQAARPCGHRDEWFGAGLTWGSWRGSGPIDDLNPTASVAATDGSIVVQLPTFFQDGTEDPQVAMVIGHATPQVIVVRASFGGQRDAMRPVEGWFALAGFFGGGRIVVTAIRDEGSVVKLVVVPAKPAAGLADHCLVSGR
jgi:hypothetical protein